MKRALLGVLSFSFATALLAEIPVSKYDEFKGDESFKAYVNGLGLGFLYADVGMRARGERPLYCPPGKLALTAENYIDIMGEAVKEWRKTPPKPGVPDPPVQLLFADRLIEVFPCQAPKPWSCGFRARVIISGERS